MVKKVIKKWKELTKGEQNGFYYIYQGHSKMQGMYDIPRTYIKYCEKRHIKETKEWMGR